MRICTVELLANERKVSLYRLMVFRWPYNCVLKNFRFAAIQTLSISSIYRERLTPGRHPTASHFEFSAANWTYRKKKLCIFSFPLNVLKDELGKIVWEASSAAECRAAVKKIPVEKKFPFSLFIRSRSQKMYFSYLGIFVSPFEKVIKKQKNRKYKPHRKKKLHGRKPNHCTKLIVHIHYFSLLYPAIYNSCNKPTRCTIYICRIQKAKWEFRIHVSKN